MKKWKAWRDEHAQSLIEYSLLLGFLALAAAAIFSASGESAKGVWVSANTQLATANTAAIDPAA